MPAKVDEQPPPAEDFGLQVSPRCYVNVWYFTLAMRVLCYALLSFTTFVYFFLARPEMSYYAAMVGPSAESGLKPNAILFGCLAAAHGLKLLTMIWHSLRSGELMFSSRSQPTEAGAENSKTRTFLRAVSTKISSWKAQPRRRALPRLLKRIKTSLVGRNGFFSLQSEYFERRFDIREAMEISSQIYQAYKSSQLISAPWINSLNVAFIALNCWSAPLIRCYCRRRRSRILARSGSRPTISTAQERMLCVVTDLILDFGSSIFVPVLIFAPYAASFNRESADFPLELLYDEVWFSNMVFAAQRVFAVNLYDSVSTLLPHVGIYMALSSLTKIMKGEYPTKWGSCSVAPPHTSDTNPPAACSTLSNASARCTQQPQGQHPKRTGALTTLFVLCGMIVGIIHARSLLVFSHVDNPSCRLLLQPRLANQYSCAIFHYNCHRRNYSSSIPNDELDLLDPGALSILILSHCPDLFMPPQIPSFANLFGIEIYNCTLAEWGEDAAISDRAHISHVNMTALPSGMLQPLPRTLNDIEIVDSNITSLPPDLHNAWCHPLAVLYLERCGFRELPPVLAKLQINELSLIGNTIESLDPYSQANGANLEAFEELAFSNMPLLNELPPWNSQALTKLLTIAIEHTGLVTLPEWLHTLTTSSDNNNALEVFAYGTPFCNALSKREVVECYGDTHALTCTRRYDAPLGKYPTAAMAMAALRPL